MLESASDRFFDRRASDIRNKGNRWNEKKSGTIDKFQCRKVERWDEEISFVEVTEGRYKTFCKSLKNLCGSPVK
jgi:hypothetical protein